jgi:hypothetical protein
MRAPRGKRSNITFPLAGGLDTMSASETLRPGVCRMLTGFEVVQGHGYRRARGWERWDSNPTNYIAGWTLDVVLYTHPAGGGAGTIPVVGDNLSGATANGNVVYVGTLIPAVPPSTSPTMWVFIEPPASPSAFVPGETLTDGTRVLPGTLTNVQHYDSVTMPRYLGFKDAARAITQAKRDLISAPPGQGRVRGVWIFSGHAYAFRDVAGGATAKMWVNDNSTGWSEVVLGDEVSFTAGNASVGVGDTLTQGGVNSIIADIRITSGDASLATAAGVLVVNGRTGGNYAAGAATSTGGGTLTLSGAQTAITLLPGGQYEFINYNFGGAGGTKKMYGVSGVHRGFQFDGTNFIPITTGMTNDKPTHVTVHMDRLWYSFSGGSLQYSASGFPLVFSAIVGAGELGFGDEVTGMRSLREDQLVVSGMNSAKALYGASFDVSSFVPLLKGVGCFSRCLGEVGGVAIAVDNIGGYFIQQGQISGDYKPTPFTLGVDTDLKAAMAVCSPSSGSMFAIQSKEKQQYRLFLPGAGAEWRFSFAGTKLIGISTMPMSSADTGAGSHTYPASGAICCACVGEDANGNEWIIGGTDAGYVVKMESTASADGQVISAICSLVYSNLKAPQNVKRLYAVELDMFVSLDANGRSGILPEAYVSSDDGMGEYEVLPGGELDDYFYLPTVRVVPGGERAVKVRFPCSIEGRTIALNFAVNDDFDPAYTLRQAAYDVQFLGGDK